MVSGLGKELLLRVSGEMEEPPSGSLKAGRQTSVPFLFGLFCTIAYDSVAGFPQDDLSWGE